MGLCLCACMKSLPTFSPPLFRVHTRTHAHTHARTCALYLFPTVPSCFKGCCERLSIATSTAARVLGSATRAARPTGDPAPANTVRMHVLMYCPHDTPDEEGWCHVSAPNESQMASQEQRQKCSSNQHKYKRTPHKAQGTMHKYKRAKHQL